MICQNIVVGPIQAAGGNFNVYDIRKPCIGQLCYDFSRLDDYLAQPDVRKALGVDDRAGTWQSCNQDVYNDFLGELRKASCPGRQYDVDLRLLCEACALARPLKDVLVHRSLAWMIPPMLF